MTSPVIDTYDVLDAATAAAIQSRRERLLRIANGNGIRVYVAYGCAAIVAICSIAALVAGDRKAAMILASQCCMLIVFVFFATTAARRKAVRELREMDVSI
jgi:hypothetical protein